MSLYNCPKCSFGVCECGYQYEYFYHDKLVSFIFGIFKYNDMVNPDKVLENVQEKLNDKPDSEYDYEALVTDDNSPFEKGSWIPVPKSRIKNINKIDEYIEQGILRKRKE